MNIIDMLKEDKIEIGIKNYGENDYITLYEINSIIENSKKILKIIKTIQIKIESNDDYINYLFLNHICSYRANEDKVLDKYKEIFNDTIDNCEEMLKKYKTSELVFFISNNYKELLDYPDEGRLKFSIREHTIKLISEYLLKNFEIINYLSSEYPHEMIDNYDDFKKGIKEHNLYDVLLSKENIKKTINFRQEEIGDILHKIKDSQSSVYEHIVNNYVEVTKSEFFGKDESEIMHYIGFIKESMKVLESLQHPLFNDYVKEYKNAQKKLDRYLEKHGEVFSYEIDLSSLFRFIDDESIDIDKRLFLLTEYYDKKEKKYYPVAKMMLDNKENHIMDMVSSNIETDEVFKRSTIEKIRTMMFSLRRTLNHIIRNGKLQPVCAHIGTCIQTYLEANKIDYEKDDLLKDVNILAYGINDLIKVFETHNDYGSLYTSFACIQLISGLIEKYLRYVYCHIKEKDYYKESNTNLSTFLEDEKMKKYLGDDLLDLLDYYLVSRKDVGLNIRNCTSHFNNDLYSMLNYGLFCEMLVLLLMLCNRILIISHKG